MRRETPRAELPTIAHDKGHGCTGVLIYCLGLHCSRSARFGFDTLGLPDATILIDIPRLKRFVCSRCGSRAVEVRSDWPSRPPRF